MALSATTRLTWSSDDLSVLEALAVKVRVMTLPQVTRWIELTSRTRLSRESWAKLRRVAKRKLAQLSVSGLIEKRRMIGPSIVDLTAPLVYWQSGDRPPCFQSISHHLVRRWRRESTPRVMYRASRLAANLFGVPYLATADICQLPHDLHVTEVLLRKTKCDRRVAAQWVGEDAVGKAGYAEIDPDAFLLNQEGDRELAVEFGGKYSTGRLIDFHRQCAQRNMPYEIW